MFTREPARGWTLVEFVMVIVIIGVLVAVSAAKMNTGSMRLRTEADRLLSHLRHAQQFAMSNGVDVEIRIIPTRPGYQVRTTDGANVPDPLGGDPLQVNFADAVTTVETDLPGNRLVFGHRLGAPAQTDGSALAVAHTITLTGQGDSVSIRLHPNTGFTEIP